MNKLGHAASFRELEVYKKSRALAKELFLISRTFPREEMFSLTDQIRRSARSIGAQVAEAWGKRRYEKHFLSELTDADGEQYETQHWIETAADCEYLTADTASRLNDECQVIGRMLNGMIAKSHQFCGLSREQ